MKPIAVILTFSCVLLSQSCGLGKGEFSNYKQLPQTGWAYIDTLVFKADTALSEIPTDLTLSLTHNEIYPYSNLWLEVTSEDNDRLIHRDTLNITLCDRAGHWYSQGSGPEYQFKQKVRTTRLRPDSEIRVRHIMRTDTLRGIVNVGILNQ